MKITITGASGFIGKHLVKELEKNHVLKLIDRTPLENQNHESLNIDISSTDTNVIKDFISGSDIVIHLIGGFTNNIEQAFSSNVLSTAKIIQACKQANVKRFVFSSSYAVYGNNTDKDNQCKETYTRNPVTIYGLSKMMAEDILQYYSKNQNIQITILRFPTVYGPGIRGGIFHYLFSAAKNHSILTIDGQGTQLRNYVFIDNIIHYINLILEHNPKDNSKDKFQIFNISNNQSTSVNELTIIAENITKKKIKKTFSDSRPFSLLIDGTKAMNTFNYKPQISLEQGMQKTWDWFNNL